jgi:hypothetical protein
LPADTRPQPAGSVKQPLSCGISSAVGSGA